MCSLHVTVEKKRPREAMMVMRRPVGCGSGGRGERMPTGDEVEDMQHVQQESKMQDDLEESRANYEKVGMIEQEKVTGDHGVNVRDENVHQKPEAMSMECNDKKIMTTVEHSSEEAAPFNEEQRRLEGSRRVEESRVF